MKYIKLFEVGDASISPVPWQELQPGVYGFELGEDLYQVNIDPMKWEKGSVNVEFSANGDRDSLTNQGRPLLVMSTVMSTVRDYLRQNPEVRTLYFVPAQADPTGMEEDDRRLRLYLAYIKKGLPVRRVVIDGLGNHKHVRVDLKSGLELGESKKFKSGSRLWESLDDSEKEAIETIARHSRDSKKLAQIYQRLPSVNIKWILSRNKEMPGWALSEMSRDQDRRIRVGTAGNPNTPAEDLIRLSKDPDRTVRSKLGDNPKAPVAALDILSRTEEAKGFGDGLGIVSHPNCSPDILLRFINHEYQAVREIARYKIKEHLIQAEPDEINRIQRLESMLDLGIDPTWEEPDLEGLDL